MQIRLASWNILNDSSVPRHEKQTNRLDQIAGRISEAKGKSSRFLIYLCEIVEPASAEYIARHTGLLALGEPTAYMMPKGIAMHSTFLADEETKSIARPEAISIDGIPNKIMGVDVGEFKVVGCHMPRPLFRSLIRDVDLREQHTDKVLEIMPDVVMGDLNSLPFFTMRRRFINASYVEAHRENRPVFPNKFFKGVNLPWWFPDISIDAMYYGNNVKQRGAGCLYSEASDHPLIWTDFEADLPA